MSHMLKVIREKCKDCCCWDLNEVALCTVNDCALHPYRMGTNPLRKKVAHTEEQKAQIAERLKKGREKKIIKS